MAQDSARVPQEIIEKIIDRLPRAPGQLDSLRAVTLASRSMGDRARRHLFRNVYLTKPFALPMQTWNIWRQSPYLFKYARRIYIRDKPGFSMDMPVSKSDFQGVLNLIKDVWHMEIEPTRLLKEWIAAGLFRTCTSILKLSIYLHQDIPFDMFNSLHRLQELGLSCGPSTSIFEPWLTPFQDTPATEAEVHTPLWQLKTLHYHGSDIPSHIHLHTAQHPHPPLLVNPKLEPHVYGGLVHLGLDIHSLSDHNFALSRILPVCRSSPLVTLRLWYTPDAPDSALGLYQTIPLGGIPSLPLLRFLCIGLLSLNAGGTTTPGHQAQGFLCGLMGQKQQPSLEAFYAIWSWDTRSLNGGIPVVQGPGWGQVDAMVTNRALYPQLRAVRLKTLVGGWVPAMYYHPTVDHDHELVLSQQMVAKLPLVKGSRMLLDVGSADVTKRDYDKIVDSIFDAAWSSKETWELESM